MNESVDDLTVEYEENGQIVIKQLDKVILSKGAWATVLFRYQQWDPAQGSYGTDKYLIQRYRKSGGEYKRQSKFNISGPEQARKIIKALESWLPENPGD